MEKYADLEIGLHRREVEVYSVEFRFVLPGSDADVRPGQGSAHFDLKALQKLAPGSTAYAQALTSGFFADPEVKGAFMQAVAGSSAAGLKLRLRLWIGITAPELHALQWEMLLHPELGSSICTDENIVFSRYLTSRDMRPVVPRPQNQLRALVVVSNPSNLSDYNNLAPIDVDGEIERVRMALGDAEITCLPDVTTDNPAVSKRAGLNNIIAALRDGGHDVLYLVCHGALTMNEPHLWLEDDGGHAAVIPGTDLVNRLRDLSQRPLLVVLASCQSAGQPTAGEALSALGPRLAEAGIPAVIAMQSNISLLTISELMPVFFTELQKDGQIDRALTAARGAVRERPDAWMPALFMRLKSGRIWYVPGFGADGKDFEKWNPIVRFINNKKCTPILGPGLNEPLLGSLREIAIRWAEAYHYPMASHERESLPQVAQYLTVNQGYDRAPYDELAEYLRQDLLDRYGSEMSPETLNGELDDIIQAVGEIRWPKLTIDPYQVLARLPLPVYITTNWNNLLAAALDKAGKDPQVVFCPWNDHVEQMQFIYTREPDYEPDVQRPLVYHLFGHLSEPESIVLTEDDYFDYLIGVTRNKDLIPGVVRRNLADSALLFLGFQMDDWQFRVLFRSILAQQGGERRGNYPHIAAQLEPEEPRIPEPERARSYLEKYFFNGANISLFWGRSEDFIKQLNQRLPPKPA